MIIRFTDVDGNIFIVPTSKITCCPIYVCGESSCSEYYHYNIVIDRIQVEVKREDFVRVFHWISDSDSKQLAVDIPEQREKKPSEWSQGRGKNKHESTS